MSTRLNLPFEVRRAFRFGFVGIANTALGYAVLLAFLIAGWGDLASNAAGYAAGLGLGFLLNGWWTFNDRNQLSSTVLLKYAATFILAYVANLCVVLASRQFGVVDNPLTHLAGIGVYSVIFYFGCLHFVYAPPRPPRAACQDRLARLITERWPEVAVFLLWALVFAAFNNLPVSHDVVWQMWIARQLLGGTELYSQIAELNPPLWFWMAVPVEWLAQSLAIPPRHAITSAVFLLIGGSLVILSILVAGEKPLHRAAVLLAAIAAMVVIAIPDFAQREHLCLIGALPYIVLAARRADCKDTHPLLAVAVALIAAPAFALKHYFVLAPIFIELWLAWKLRRGWRPLRPETIGLAAGALSYTAAVFWFAPEFLAAIVPAVTTAYDGFARPWYISPTRPWIFVWMLSALLIYFRRHTLPSISVAAALATLAFCVGYFLQAKGWRYHALPATGALFLAVANLLPGQKWARSEDIRIAGLVAALALPIGFSLYVGPYLNLRAPFVDKLIADLRPGQAVAALTGNPSNIWPMVEERGLLWSPRYFTYWMVYAIFDEVNAPTAQSAAMREVADKMRSDTVEDFLCHPPEMIIVDDFRASLRPGLSVLHIFNQSEDFRAIFSHYRKDRSIAIYTTYGKDPEWRPPPPEGCRQIF